MNKSVRALPLPLPVLPALLLAAMTSGCPRVVLPPPPPSSTNTVEVVRSEPLGAACTAADACRSGFCVDGVCCQRACDATESCALDRALGSCTVRSLGDACGDGQPCGRGTCVDGYCCDSACTGTCMSCAVPGHLGTCMQAEDNTDRRGDCGGACLACFGGQCLLADTGTNPRGMCMEGTVCDDVGACRGANGTACSNGMQCASGTCVLQQCTGSSANRITDNSFDSEAEKRGIFGVVTDGAGEAVLLMRETTRVGAGSRRRHLVMRPTRGTGATLVAEHTDCLDEVMLQVEQPQQALVAVGTRVFVAVGDFDYACAVQPNLARGIHGYWLDSGLHVSRTDLVFDALAFDAVLYWMDAAFDAVSSSIVVFGFGNNPDGATYPVRAREYSLVNGTWGDSTTWVEDAWIGGRAVTFRGRPLVTSGINTNGSPYLARNVLVTWKDGSGLQQEAFNPDCNLYQAEPLVVRTGTDEQLVVSWICAGDTEDELQWSRVDLTAQAGSRFGPVTRVPLGRIFPVAVLGNLGNGRVVLAQAVEPENPSGVGNLVISDASAGDMRVRDPASAPWPGSVGADSVWAMRTSAGLVLAYSLIGINREPGSPSAWFTTLEQ